MSKKKRKVITDRDLTVKFDSMLKKAKDSLFKQAHELHTKFDSLIAKADAPKQKKKKLLKKNKCGRPRSGRILFQQQRIDSLPLVGNLSEVARKLGIKHTTLQQWCVLKEHPVPFVQDGDHKMFRKDVLIRWLVATKRFTEIQEVRNGTAAAN